MVLLCKGMCALFLPLSKDKGQCLVIHPCSGIPDWQFRQINHNGSQARISSVPPVIVHFTATY